MPIQDSQLKNALLILLSFSLLLSLVAHALRPGAEGGPQEPPAAAPEPGAGESLSETALPDLPDLPDPPDPGEEALGTGLADTADPAPPPPEEPAPPAEPEPDPRFVRLARIFDTAESSPGLLGAAVGFALVDKEGTVVCNHRGDIAQIPASALKTLTTATALEVLGPNFRFETRLGLVQPSDSGDIEGDLVLRGGGDPTLSLDDLDTWAASLAEAGVASVSGRIVGDGRFFEGSSFPDFWDWGDIGNGYGSPVSGLNLERNRFLATLVPGTAEEAPVSIEDIFPEVPGVSWWNEATTGPAGSGDGITIYGGERATVMHVRGTVPLENELTVRGAVPDPEKFAAHHLREALLAAGITVEGPAVTAGELFLAGEAVPEIAEDLLVHQSPTLFDIVQSIHATSDNHETECLFRIIGIRSDLPPADAVRQHWEARGLDLTGLRMVDGSGLARADHITPRSLARLQHLASSGPMGELYEDSLLTGMDARLRFKAGMMSAVRAYTGLLDTESDERYAFALIVNHYSDPDAVGELLHEVVSSIAAW